MHFLVSLKRVADRLRLRLANRGYRVSDDGSEMLREMVSDLDGALDDEELATDPDDTTTASPTPEEPVPESDERMRAELEVVERFVVRAQSLGHDSKARCLIDALRVVQERGARGEGAGKAVIFTESLTTQAYLRRLALSRATMRTGMSLCLAAKTTRPRRSAPSIDGSARSGMRFPVHVSQVAKSQFGWRWFMSSQVVRRSSSQPKRGPRA